MSQHQSLTPLKVLLFSFYATNTIIVGYLPLYLQYKGLTGKEIGWVLAIGPLVSIFAQPFWGYMSDKYKTVKRIILLCALMLLITGLIFFQMNELDRKSTRLNSSHVAISYAVFCLKKKK